MTLIPTPTSQPRLDPNRTAKPKGHLDPVIHDRPTPTPTLTPTPNLTPYPTPTLLLPSGLVPAPALAYHKFLHKSQPLPQRKIISLYPNQKPQSKRTPTQTPALTPKLRHTPQLLTWACSRMASLSAASFSSRRLWRAAFSRRCRPMPLLESRTTHAKLGGPTLYQGPGPGGGSRPQLLPTITTGVSSGSIAETGTSRSSGRPSASRPGLG